MSFALASSFRGKNYAYIRRAIVFNLMVVTGNISKRITFIMRYMKICILVSVKMISESESGERERERERERQTDRQRDRQRERDRQTRDT